jgi:hypothetical protein
MPWDGQGLLPSNPPFRTRSKRLNQKHLLIGPFFLYLICPKAVLLSERMPLTIYRRHALDCSHRSKGRRWHRCSCPIWVQGSLGGEYVRESLNMTVWGAAQ